jgi:thiol-disulfide isomerase/thioredoxin
MQDMNRRQAEQMQHEHDRMHGTELHSEHDGHEDGGAGHVHVEAPAMPYAVPAEDLAPGFEDLPGTDGKRYSLDSFAEADLLVVVFAGNGCPTTRALEPWLMQLQRDYEELGVRIILINSNNSSLSPADAFEEIVKHVGRHPFTLTYLKDDNRQAARSFGATHTPQAFILDSNRLVRYRGRPADARRPQAISEPYLELAIDDLLAGREPGIPETEPYGCAIVW